MSFETRLATARTTIAARLDGVLGDLADLALTQAMRHATTGGKRLRGFLVLESARLHGVAPAAALDAAVAVECLHAYSLVHDDLPAMDDDDLRRGQPTVHVRWDEATAILAGDALQALAFELLARPGALPAARQLQLVAGLATAVGARGMVLGQALDIAAETAGRPLTLAEITRLQDGKTGALIGWSATAGAVMAGADPAALRDYAAALGLAFQIVDDILDVAGDAAAVGKALRKDAVAGKATFVSLLGLAGARDRAAELVATARAALASYGDAAGGLLALADHVVARDS